MGDITQERSPFLKLEGAEEEKAPMKIHQISIRKRHYGHCYMMSTKKAHVLFYLKGAILQHGGIFF
jgi:hypothetical protein